jgi:23S rRNA (pseudouridine1915-N3)-methyltransferase
VKLTLLTVGRLKDAPLRALCEDYRGRIARYVDVREQEVKDDRALVRALPKEALLVTLEVHGAAVTSSQLSERLLRWGSTGNGHVCFVIGGAEGIPAEVRKATRFELSLSSLTLPHRLARLILLEQLYRALTIWRGEPYARED